jgi:uncharacterized protein YggE
MEQTYKKLAGAATLALMLVSVFVAVKIVQGFQSNELSAENTITVDGDAEVFAAPDIATISFGASATNKDLKMAQAEVETNSSAAIDAVKALGIDAKDIQTTYYNAYPQYDYKCGQFGCGNSNGNLIGYQVTQTTTVKVHDLSKVSSILGAVGGAKVSDIQGPNFDIEKKDELQTQARADAIKEAKEKAKVLAKELGVNLGRIVSFNEGGYGGGPIMYATKLESAQDSRAGNPAPTIETGQNRIYSSVSIVYRVK